VLIQKELKKNYFTIYLIEKHFKKKKKTCNTHFNKHGIDGQRNFLQSPLAKWKKQEEYIFYKSNNGLRNL